MLSKRNYHKGWPKHRQFRRAEKFSGSLGDADQKAAAAPVVGADN
jgi:hypothetical protein